MIILFVCNANASRSQIAEAWFNILTAENDKFCACSAGIKPAEKISGKTLAVMNEVGIDISDNFPKAVDYFGDTEFNYVITLSDEAKENLPELPGKPMLIHTPVDDPFEVIGTEDEMLETYRESRDSIRILVESLIAQLSMGK